MGELFTTQEVMTPTAAAELFTTQEVMTPTAAEVIMAAEAPATGVVPHFPMAGALIPRQRTGALIPRRMTGRQQITMRMYMSVRAGSAMGRWIAPTAATR